MYRNRDMYWTKVQYMTPVVRGYHCYGFFGRESPGGQQGGTVQSTLIFNRTNDGGQNGTL
jgi:hypothetical protein